jgi:hypothetical protein
VLLLLFFKLGFLANHLGFPRLFSRRSFLSEASDECVLIANGWDLAKTVKWSVFLVDSIILE